MAKFGLYDQGGVNTQNPKQDYEGDYLFAKDDVVCVMVKDSTGPDKAYAVIRLAQGQSVKKIND